MEGSFITIEELSQYLSLPIEVIDDLTTSGVIHENCYFQYGDIRRYFASRVEQSLIEYTKKSFNKQNFDKYEKSRCDEEGYSFDRLIFTINLLEGLIYSLAKSRDSFFSSLEDIVYSNWDFDFNKPIISALKSEIEPLIDLCESNSELKRNISVVLNEINDFEEDINYKQSFSDALSLIDKNIANYSEDVIKIIYRLRNSNYDASVIIDWINQSNIEFQKMPSIFSNPWNKYISTDS